MKARIKETDEIVDVVFLDSYNNYVNYINSKGELCEFEDISIITTDIIPSLIWEKRRYQIAKDILANFAISNELRVLEAGSKQRVKWAIEEADELIKQLKGE